MTDILQQFMNGIENTRTLTSVSGLSMIGFAALFIFGVLNCILGYRLLRFWMMLFGFAIGAGLGIGAAYSMNVTEKYLNSLPPESDRALSVLKTSVSVSLPSL